MELQVRAEQVPGKISFNYEEIRENLTQMMELYKDAKFSEDTVTVAKKEIATLRKIKDALSSRRVEIKKECLKPYNDFEEKVKELTALIDQPIVLIDTQIKSFEEKKKADKRLKIQKIYKEAISDFEEYLPLQKIYNQKWENATFSIKAIKEEIEELVASTEAGVGTIIGMNSDAGEKALQQYKADLSISNAILYINKYEQQKAEIMLREQQRQQEVEKLRQHEAEERIRREERQKIADEERIRKEEQEKIREEQEKIRGEWEAAERENKAEKPSLDSPFKFEDILPDTEVVEDVIAIDNELPFVTANEIKSIFTMIGTLNELEQVELYLNSIGIYYERRDI